MDQGAAGNVADIDHLVVIWAEDEAVLAGNLVGELVVRALFLNWRFGSFRRRGRRGSGRSFRRGIFELVRFREFFLLFQEVPLLLNLLLFCGGGGFLRRVSSRLLVGVLVVRGAGGK